MRPEREIEPTAGLSADRRRSPIADRAAALFRRRDRVRPASGAALPLTDDERRHYVEVDFALDAAGSECLQGLSRAESLDYIALQRTGLDNDDDAFLRLIQLGDRHVSAMRVAVSDRAPADS